MEMTLIEFEVLIQNWRNSIEMERNAFTAGIDLDEFIQPFYKTIETLVEKIFDDKIDDIYEFVYNDSELSTEEFYKKLYKK
jgi:hypothetical protein